MTTTTWTLNPSVYLRHAWEKTNSRWGKMSLVLFYLLIWLGIIKCIYGLFDPTMMGHLTCFLGKHDDETKLFFYMMMRGLFLYALAFLFYADKAGLHSWNVGFVMVVVVIYIVIVKMTFNRMDDTVYEKCVGQLGNWIYLSVVWCILPFIGIVIDERMADTGTPEERTNLNV